MPRNYNYLLCQSVTGSHGLEYTKVNITKSEKENIFNFLTVRPLIDVTEQL